MKYVKPNLDHEWMEALRYREFEKMGKDGWKEIASNNYTVTNYESIKDKLNNVDLDFDTLDPDKKKRFEKHFEEGSIEMPIAVKFSDDDYDLLGGNTRLSGLIGKGINPKLYIVDLSKTHDYSKDEEIDEGENKPTKPELWSRAKSMAKSKFDVYPSAYANGWASKWYKEHGGGWRKKSTNESEEVIDEDLRRWFKEKWVDVSKKVDGEHPPCGRKDADGKSYPKCRPSKKVSKDTPKIASSYDKDEKKAMTQQKRRAEKEDPKVGKGNKPTMTHYDEQTSSDASGSFAPAMDMTKREIYKLHNVDLKEEEEFKEATDSSSSGAFDVPAFGKTTKGGRRNPLKIDGPDSIYKGRAVKDKNFPKWGGPGGLFVKVKEKCKKFPYCNQGNTGALEFIKEDEEITNAITEISKKYGIPHKEVENIVLNEINKIFI